MLACECDAAAFPDRRKNLPDFDGPLVAKPINKRVQADARALPLTDDSIDMVVTSPPYWLKRDYGLAGQIGQEATAQEYVNNLVDCMSEWAACSAILGFCIH